MNTWTSHCERVRLLIGDCRESLKTLPDASVHCCVTSPPYFGLRSYNGGDAEIGTEQTPGAYVAELVAVFREVRRVLMDDGTVWLNLGDSYSSGGRTTTTVQTVRGNCSDEARRTTNTRPPVIDGIKPKDLIGIPWRVAFALQADGWYLRSEIIWHKPNPMPESVTDRPTKSHEQIFLLTKSARYWYDAEAVREPHSERALRDVGKPNVQRTKEAKHHADGADMHGRYGADTYASTLAKNGGIAGHPNGRNRRSVWTVATQPYSGAHFATFPPKLIEPCILAGCPKDGTTLDPFNGAGTTALVAIRNNRRYIGCELNPEYATLTRERLAPELAQGRLAI